MVDTRALAKDPGLMPEPRFRRRPGRIVKRAVHTKRKDELFSIANAELVGTVDTYGTKVVDDPRRVS
jgi:hypothetical protein